MKALGRFLVVILAVSVMSPLGWGVTAGPGGYVYWSTHNGPMPWYRAIVEYNLRRVTLNASWDNATVPETFDKFVASSTLPVGTGATGDRYRFDYYFGQSGLEVLDPRDQGGLGRVIRANIANDTPGGPYPTGNAHDADQPWDIVLADPANPGASHQSLLCDGKIPSTTEWDTQGLLFTLVAPKSWTSGLAPGTLALVTVGRVGTTQTAQTGKVCFAWDANHNGVIDNTPSEGAFVGTGARPSDVEASSNALWVSSNKEYLANPRGGGSVERWTKNGDGTFSKSVFFDYAAKGADPNNPVGYSAGGAGIAVGSGDSPIVYLLGHNQTAIAGNTANNNLAIFALRDGDGDNVVNYADPLDLVKQVWESGQAGVTVPGIMVDTGQDLELWTDPNTGKRMLFFNTYDGALFTLELSDNGLQAIDGKKVLTEMRVPGQGNNYRSGFELDLNPVAAVPEPMTLLLVGTGLLASMGIARRRRMR